MRHIRPLALFAAFAILAVANFSDDLVAAGRLLQFGDFFTTEKTALVDNDRLLISDSEASGAVKYAKISNLPGGSETPEVPDALYGLLNLTSRNNAANPDEDIDIDADAIVIEGYLTTNVDITIDGSEGHSTPAANGWDGESPPTAGLVYVFCIYNPSSETLAGLASTLPDTTALPTGYTRKRLIAIYRTDDDDDLLPQTQRDNRVDQTPALTCASGLTETDWEPQSITACVPSASGLVTDVLFGATAAANAYDISLSHNGEDCTTVFSATNTNTAAGQTSSLYLNHYSSPVFIPIDGNQIHYKVSGSSFALIARAYHLSLGTGGVGPAEQTGPPYPPKYISGMVISNNATDADADIDISAGSARASTDDYNIDLASALTKQLDATWAAGDDAGGRSTDATHSGAELWHVYACYNPTTGAADVYFADDPADAAPSGYTKTAWIGHFLTDGDGDILPFTTSPPASAGKYLYFWPDTLHTIASGLDELTWTSQVITGSVPADVAGAVVAVQFSVWQDDNSHYFYLSNSSTGDSTVKSWSRGQSGNSAVYNSFGLVAYQDVMFIPISGTNIFYRTHSGTATSLMLRAVIINRNP
jgi:hypothetical protein